MLTAANDRSVVFNRHSKLGMVERELRLPPCTDMVVPQVGEEAPVQRCEITFAIPVVQEETQATVPEESIQVVGDLDLAFLDPEVGEKNVTEEGEANNINVAHTIEAINNADAVAAPDEIEEVASVMENPRLASADDSGPCRKLAVPLVIKNPGRVVSGTEVGVVRHTILQWPWMARMWWNLRPRLSSGEAKISKRFLLPNLATSAIFAAVIGR